MPLPDTTVWEARATGNDNNGGAFITGASGTDYSKQNAPQYALTGVTSSGSGDTILSALAASDMVGNVGQVISGSNFNTGWFPILSVVVGVSITFDTNNAGSHICSGTGSSGVINIGGGLATFTQLITAINWNQTAYLKGTFTLTTALALTLFIDSTHGQFPIKFIGYTTTRGDNGRATITTATNSADLLHFNFASGYEFHNIDFSSTAGTPGDGLVAASSQNSGNILLVNCLVHGFHIGIKGDWQTVFSFGSIVLFKSAVYSCTNVGILNDGLTILLASYVHDNVSDGIKMGSNTGAPVGIILVWRSVIKSNGGKGINDTFEQGGGGGGRFPVIIESDILNNTGDGIDTGTNTSTALILINSIVDGNGVFGFNAAAKWALQLIASVAWRNNTSGDVNNAIKSSTDVTLTGDPFTNRSGDDFTLNSTSGAGQACKAIGEPTTFPPA